jgi:hypothetical protein
MITDTRFLCEMVTMWKADLMESDWLRVVGGLCIRYYQSYGEAPGRNIEGLFEGWRRSSDDPSETKQMLRQFLSSISREYDMEGPRNPDYLLDQSERMFRERALKQLKEDVDFQLAQGSVDEAQHVVDSFRLPSRPAHAGVDPFKDKEGFKMAFAAREEPLFVLPGYLGELLGGFYRDELGAYMGPEKRGKTWWLLYTALRALENRCKVAYFQIGDLSQPQVYTRIGVYLTKRHYDPRYCIEFEMPTLDCRLNQSGECDLRERRGVGKILDEDGNLPPWSSARDHKICNECHGTKRWRGSYWYKIRRAVEPIHWSDAWMAAKEHVRRVGQGQFRLVVYNIASNSVRDIEGQLDRWEREEEFVPDVIVIDYADNLAPITASLEFRHQQNETWSALRRVSQDRHCCVITATQADARAYDSKDVRATHFTEDKRKYGHVNHGIFTLNQTGEEKTAMIIRVGRMFAREEFFDERTKAVVLQCLQIGRPYLGSWREGR